jgi:hypothetical protein
LKAGGVFLNLDLINAPTQMDETAASKGPNCLGSQSAWKRSD